MFGPIFTLSKGELYFILSIFIIGLLAGAISVNLYASKIIDYYLLENKILMDKLQNLHNRIDKLNKTINKQKNNPVREINIELQSNLNEHNKQEIKKNVLNISENIIGTEISEIDIDLLIKSINNKYKKKKKKKYHLQLIYVVLAEETKILIKVE